jgi:hypothetical protein
MADQGDERTVRRKRKPSEQDSFTVETRICCWIAPNLAGELVDLILSHQANPALKAFAHRLSDSLVTVALPPKTETTTSENKS